MNSGHTTQRAERGRRRRLAGLVVIGLAAMTIGAASLSLALFTSAATVNGNSFTTGTVVIGTNPATSLLSATALMPGDSVPSGTPGAPITVSNTGTAQLRYAISGTSTDADNLHLNTQLVLTVRQPDGNTGSSCTAMTGNVLFNGVVPTTGVNMVGDPTQGFQTGDRTLDAGTSETLCFKASLPIGTGNAFQGATSDYTFTFSAEQTANN